MYRESTHSTEQSYDNDDDGIPLRTIPCDPSSDDFICNHHHKKEKKTKKIKKQFTHQNHGSPHKQILYNHHKIHLMYYEMFLIFLHQHQMEM